MWYVHGIPCTIILYTFRGAFVHKLLQRLNCLVVQICGLYIPIKRFVWFTLVFCVIYTSIENKKLGSCFTKHEGTHYFFIDRKMKKNTIMPFLFYLEKILRWYVFNFNNQCVQKFVGCILKFHSLIKHPILTQICINLSVHIIFIFTGVNIPITTYLKILKCILCAFLLSEFHVYELN